MPLAYFALSLPFRVSAYWDIWFSTSRTHRPYLVYIDVSSIISSGDQLSPDILNHRKPVCMVGILREGWTTFQEPRTSLRYY